MKMLIVSNKFPYPLKDGGAIAMFNMIKGLHGEGVDLTVLSMNTDKHPVDLNEIEGKIGQYAEFYAVTSRIKPNAIDALGHLLFSQNSYIVSRFYQRGFARTLINILKEAKDDQFKVVQLETLYMTPYAKIVKKYAPDALITYRSHNVEHEIWERMAYNTDNLFRRYALIKEVKRLKTFETQVIKNFKKRFPLDMVVAISGRDAGSLKKMREGKKEEKNRDPFAPNKPDPPKERQETFGTLWWKAMEWVFVSIFYTIMNFTLGKVPLSKLDKEKPKAKQAPIETCTVGIDIDRIETWEEEQLSNSNPITLEYPSVFFLGALDWPPNQEGIIWFLDEVWPILHSRYPELRFYVAGRRMPQSLYKRQQLGVTFLGEIEDAYAFMKEKAIMVAPLFSGSGIRVKIIEGLGMGNAIVATSIAAEGLEIKHGQNIFIADNEMAFADCISILIDKRSVYNHMSQQGKQLAQKKYNNQALVNGLLKKYKAALGD